MKSLKKLLAAGCMMLAAVCTAFAQDEVIPLYDGPAPGSETWDWDETMYLGMIADVSHPTLTVYRPEHPNGVGMVVCAGGAFCFLCYDREGEYISKVYNEMGITCFALKYRVYHDADKDRLVKNLTEGKMDSLCQYTLPLALQDAAQAIRYVRAHAADYGIDPERIGISGSSAGGTVTMGTAMAFTDEQSRPNYAVATYPYLSPHILRQAPDNHPLPLYIAACSDDSMVPIAHSLEFYRIWLDKGQKAEMHIYQKGEHGFVGQQFGLECDHWTDNLHLWFKDIYPDNFK